MNYCTHSISKEDAMAIEFTIASHAGQYRNTGEPFHMHPLRMYEDYVRAGGNDSETRQAILLHDVAEDTKETLLRIGIIFGHSVRNIVDANTRHDEQGNALDPMESVQKFIRFSRKDYRCLVVKLLDCIDNLNTIHGLSVEKQVRFKAEKRELYLPVFQSMAKNVPEPYQMLYRKKLYLLRSLLV